MVAVIDLVDAIFATLAAFVPAGIQPAVFYAVFLIVFSIANQIVKQVPGMDQRNLHVILGAVLAYFTSTSAFAVILLTDLFPSLGIVLLFGIFGLIITTFISGDNTGQLKGIAKYFMFGMFIWVIWNSWKTAALKTTGVVPSFIEIQPQDWPQIILLVILAIGFIAMFGGGRGLPNWAKEWKEFGPPW